MFLSNNLIEIKKQLQTCIDENCLLFYSQFDEKTKYFDTISISPFVTRQQLHKIVKLLHIKFEFRKTCLGYKKAVGKKDTIKLILQTNILCPTCLQEQFEHHSCTGSRLCPNCKTSTLCIGCSICSWNLKFQICGNTAALCSSLAEADCNDCACADCTWEEEAAPSGILAQII